MNKGDLQEERSLQIQWAFVILGATLAVVLGIAVNATYSLLKTRFSDWYIFALGVVPGLLFIDILNYAFENLREIKRHPNKSFCSFLWDYAKMRFNFFRNKIKGLPQ
ncbi:MAG TPA: hypothetical protein VHD55_01400 [Candidatus Paceibacterota bacterium]|nr:hypothetical protein [Candidatus Paceibacterota bacterium]